MASDSTLAIEKRKTSRVSTGIHKLFSKLSPSIATRSASRPRPLSDLQESDSARRDAKAVYKITTTSLKHLCERCKTLNFIRLRWRFFIRLPFNRYQYKQIPSCFLCHQGAKVTISSVYRDSVYRYMISHGRHNERTTRKAIFLCLYDGDITVHIHTLPETDTPLCATLSSMERADIRLAIQWIDWCRQNHMTTCRKNVEYTVPGFKVIDCINGQICTRASDRPYVALSYVWGPPPKTSQPALGKPPRGFPRTIQDAMIVAKELEVPYLWVDRYCIDQDNRQEKHIMISNMDKIYSGATVTIIAAAGSDPNYGLPGVSTANLRRTSMHKLPHGSLVGCLSANYEIANSLWATRGWTYQEMLLSRRRLVFTDSQMVFQCCSEEFSEALSVLNPHRLMPHKSIPPTLGLEQLGSPRMVLSRCDYTSVFPESGVDTFGYHIYDRIKGYTGRTLSHPGDILNAFEGIFSAFVRDTHGFSSHFWGIPIVSHKPSESFLDGLTWYVPEPASRRPGCWPWWSWTSIIGKSITFDAIFSRKHHLGICDCTFTRKNEAKEDIVSYEKAPRDCADHHPWIDFTARLLEGCTLNKESKSPSSPSTLVHPSLKTKPIVVYLDVHILGQQLFSPVTVIYVCLKYSSVSFIIAQDVGDGSLKRIGYGRGTTQDWTESPHGEFPSLSEEWLRKKVRLA
jgi:hypothetical protein